VPHAYLYTAGALRALGTELEEAARAAGAGAWKVALGVSLPMVLPAILSAGVLVFFFGFELFGLPLVLGDPQGLLVLSTYLFKLGGRLGVQANQFMAVAAVIVIAIALPLAFMQRALLREAQRHVPTRIRSARAAPHKLGRWRWPVLVIIALWLAATVLVPLAGITLRSVTGSWKKGTALLQALTFDHYRELLDHGDALRSIANTLAIGLLGGAAALACYAALALAVHRRPIHCRTFHHRTFHHRTWRWTQAVDYLVMAPRAMPGLVAGLALLWVLLLLKPLTPLRETLASVWLAYAILWMAYGLRVVSGSLLQVNPELEDAARAVGAAEARVRRDITFRSFATPSWQAGCSSSSSSCGNMRPAFICLLPGRRSWARSWCRSGRTAWPISSRLWRWSMWRSSAQVL